MEKKRMLMCKPSEVRTIPVPHNEPIIVYFFELVRYGTLPCHRIFSNLCLQREEQEKTGHVK